MQGLMRLTTTQPLMSDNNIGGCAANDSAFWIYGYFSVRNPLPKHALPPMQLLQIPDAAVRFANTSAEGRKDCWVREEIGLCR